MTKLFIGNDEWKHDGWNMRDIFYPRDVKDKLNFYSSIFNTVSLDGNFEDSDNSLCYDKLIVSTRSNFKFVIKIFPSKLLKNFKEKWNIFWKGFEGINPCEKLHKAGKLGCIEISFDPDFRCNMLNISRLKKLEKVLPSDVSCSFEFTHRTWRPTENLKLRFQDLFKKNSNWSISIPFIENSLVNCGWAGTLSSSRVCEERKSDRDLLLFRFYGSLGERCGSYDQNSFLEKFSSSFEKAKEVFIIFENTDTTFCYPLPALTSINEGIFLIPLYDLPSHTKINRPCCLHDSMRLLEIWNQSRENYEKDENGFVKIRLIKNIEV